MTDVWWPGQGPGQRPGWWLPWQLAGKALPWKLDLNQWEGAQYFCGRFDQTGGADPSEAEASKL